MTLEELCSELDVSAIYLTKQWTMIKARRAMEGIYLYKMGRGSRARYGVRIAGEEKVRWEHKEGFKI